MTWKLTYLTAAAAIVFGVLAQSFESPIPVTLNYGTARLKWNLRPPGELVTGYSLHYITPLGQTNNHGTVSAVTSNFPISSFVPNPAPGKYGYFVQAINQFGTSPPSQTVWVEYAPFPPGVPDGVTVE